MFRRSRNYDKRIITFTLCLIIIAVLIFGCTVFLTFMKKNKRSEKLSSETTVMEEKGDLASSNNSGTEAETASKMDSETETESISEMDSETETETVSKMDSETEAESVSEMDSETEAETVSEMNSETETETAGETNSQEKLENAYSAAIGLYVVIDQNQTELMEIAGDSSSMLTIVPGNLAVAVLEQKNIDGVMWDKVNYYGLTGWIRDDNLTQLGGPEAVDQLNENVYVISEEDKTVPIYKEASENSEILMDVNYGSEMTLLSTESDWGRVDMNGKAGWIKLTNITPYFSDGYYYVNTDSGMGLNVRTEPDSNSELVMVLSNGDTYKIEEFRNGWGKIKNGDTEGWVILRYMTPCEDSNGGEYLKDQEVSTPVDYDTGTVYSDTGKTAYISNDELNWNDSDELEWQ